MYVFGNTESNDYDATSGNGAFVSVLGADLNTVAFYRPSDRKIAGVTLAEGGFLLALGDSGGVSLALMNYDGEVTATAPATDGEFAALRLTDEGYALITGVTHSPLSKKKLLLRAYDFSLGLTLERMISSPYSLDFVDVFKTGDTYTVFFNATSDLSRHAGTAVCRLSADEPKITYVDKGGAYRAAAVAPVQSGWAMAAIYEDGDGAVMLIDGDFNKKTVVFQGASRPDSAVLDYCDGAYYVGFFGENPSVSLAYDPTFTVRRYAGRGRQSRRVFSALRLEKRKQSQTCLLGQPIFRRGGIARHFRGRRRFFRRDRHLGRPVENIIKSYIRAVARVIFLLCKSDISPIGEVISAYGGLRISTSLPWGIPRDKVIALFGQ